MTERVCLRAASKRFGRTTALHPIDLSLGVGERLALLGANGAGKSTLLRLVAGLARPTHGAVTIAGHAAHTAAARGCVGYLGHATLLTPALTAHENLVFAARLYGVQHPDARARTLLDAVGLTGAADRPARGLSRGMAQRLAIARARIHEPPVLLLDEPFAGLDRGSAARLAAQLSEQAGSDRTLLLVTHDVGRALALCERVVVLERGVVAHDGPSDAISAQTLDDLLARANAA